MYKEDMIYADTHRILLSHQRNVILSLETARINTLGSWGMVWKEEGLEGDKSRYKFQLHHYGA